MATLTIKVGSNVLTGKDGMLNTARRESLSAQIASLMKTGHRIVLVSSGAMAAGRGMTDRYKELDPVAQRQLLSSIGQVKLIDTYKQIFDRHNLSIGQLLLTKQDLRTRAHYLNMKSCIEVLWASGVLPIVNENDAVSLTGLMFTDNDELSGLIASMMDCEKLLILSNIDGIFDGDPKSEGAKVIREVRRGTSVAQYVQVTKSDFGRGGMVTKCRMAQKTAQAGIDVYIANGATENVISRIVEGDKNLTCTHFEAAEHSTAVKKWIAYSDGFATARIIVNDGAVAALQDENIAKSLLPVGIETIEGDFKKDDIVMICKKDGSAIGVGRAATDKETAMRSRKTKKQRPTIHYDYMYIYPTFR